RRPHRDKQIAVFVHYLFAASPPRQVNQRFRALSIRGGFTATSTPAFLCIIYSRWSHHGKRTSTLSLCASRRSPRRKQTRSIVHCLFAPAAPPLQLVTF